MQFSNVQSVELAFKRLTGSRLGLLQGGGGRLDVTTLPDFLDKMARRGIEVNATRLRMTQAMYDPSSDGMVFFADRMEAGKEEAVILHELVHKNGHRVLDRNQWSSVVETLKGWSAAAPGTAERRIHDWAYEHAEREGRGRPGVLEEELFAYGVEAAVNLGVRPRAEADLNSAESWLYRAQVVMQKVIDAQLGRARLELTVEDLVDLAYAFARIEASPQRAELIAKLREGTAGPGVASRNFGVSSPMVVPRAVPAGRLMVPAAAAARPVSANPANRSSAAPWETPEFKAWFKSSKVVEPSGRPRVVYHGTNASFSVFKPSETGEMGAGIYFGSEDSAFEYASGDDGDQILPVYLSLQNPLVIRGNYTLGEEKYGVESPAGYLLEHLFGEEGAERRFAEMQNAADNKLGAEIQQAVEALGHDGVVIDWGDIDGKPNRWHVAFRPEQVKSAIGNNGDFSADSPNILQSTATPMFYSQLQRAIEQAPGRLAGLPASQWSTWLTGNASRLGIKAEEMEWSGVLDFLQAAGQKKFTRGELLSYLSESGVQVQVMGYGGVQAGFNVRPSPSRGGWEAQDPDGQWWGGYANEAEARKAAHSESPTKYAKYVVPGGKNYRELLLTLPTERSPVMRERFTLTNDAGEVVVVGTWPPSERSRAYLDEHPDWTLEREMVPDKYDAIKLGAYQSNHWAELNVIAHIRVDERDDGQGRRVLFVHEIQSDWGQEGKRKGFKGDFPQAVMDAAVAGGMSEPQARSDIEHLMVQPRATEERDTSEQWDRLTKATRETGIDLNEVFHDQPQEQVVRGPFVMKTEAWVGLAVKRLVSYAAQNGLDAVAFASGVQVSRMFDMSKQVGSVYYDRNGVGKGTLTAMPVGKTIEDDVEPVISEDNVGESDLERFIGKDLTRKLLDTESGEHGHALVGEDLKLSNDGILAFYDRLLPQITADVLRRIGGSKPQPITLPPAAEGEEATSQMAFGIDPVLREKVRAEGLPLFRKRSQVDGPEFSDWFKGSQVVTDDGRPLVVFHGTDRDFDQFGQTMDMGYHFGSAGTANRVLANVSKRAAREKNTDPALRLIPVYLSLKNPVTLSADPGSWMPDYVIKLLQEQGALSTEEASRFDAMALDALDAARAEANRLRDAKIDVRREPHPFLPNETSYELKNWRWVQVLAQHNAPVYAAIRQALLDKGHDGLKYVNTYERASRKKNDPANISWVAFKPEQIKSALANTGEFDASNPYIARRTAGVTVTPEFQRWFGKSQIREKDGTPLVVYHGTKSDIVEFDPAKTEDGGLHFGMAEQAAYRASGAGGQIMPVYLSAEKLKRYRDDGTGWIGKIRAAKKAGADGIVYLNRFECMTTEDVEDFAARGLLNKLDGMSDLQFKRLFPQAQDSFIVFKAEQVKSALANDGQFRVGQASILSRSVDRFQTPEFKAFFEGSRVVDELGRPRIMYHGTSRDFDAFDRLKSTEWRRPSMDTVGSWFSSDPDRAQGYAGGEGLNIRPVVLSIKNPKVYSRFNDFLREMHAAEGRVLEEQNPRGIGSTEGLRNKLKAEGYDGIVFEQTDNSRLYRDIEQASEAIRVAKREQWEVPKNKRADAKLKVQRLEATLASMTKELNDMGGSTEFDGHDVWVAFEPEQIKSAIGNTGDFSPNEASTLRKSGPQTTTPEFQQWFGDSKIVDVQGRPLVVYHGSAGKEFTAFNRRKLGRHNDNAVSKLGFFFTPDKDIADDYAYQASWNLARDDRPHNEDDQKVYSVYLAISNPVVIDASEIDGFLAGGEELSRLVKEAKKKGHDGAIINNWDDGSGADVQYVAFKPEQIKSATDNNGEFDAANPDITRRALQQSATPEFKAFFGKSKVVDERGVPKVVYHGTRSDFQVFHPGKHGANVDNPTTRMGFFFTESANGADRWANYLSRISRKPDGQSIMPVFLAIERPRKISATRFLYLLKSARASTIDKFVEESMEAGYDGFQIEYDGTGDSGQPRPTEQWWVAFRPEQIKSAIGNNGEFDAANPDITRRAVAQVDTPEFAAWFDGSQVIGDKGEPLVVYHGTTKGPDFSVFRVPAFFTNSKEFAGHYADTPGEVVLPVYLSLKNPVRIDAAVHELGADAEELANDPQWVRAQKRAGFDGLVVQDGDVTTYVAFRPEQIKSASDNNGEFDASSPDINRRAVRQTETPEFSTWFKDSKILDQAGRPLLVYHGTNNEFTQFDPTKTGSNFDAAKGAFFFTPDIAFAEQMADFTAEESGSPRVIQAYLNVTNPLVRDFSKSRSIDVGALILEAKEGGHDGVVALNAKDAMPAWRATQYIVFRPEQIKSATDNNGEFDASNPDITRRAMNQTQTPEFLSWFNRSQILDAGGQPLVVYHYGSFGEGDNVVPSTPMHFGTRAAALQRAHEKLVDDAVMKVTAYQGDDGAWHWDDAQGFTSEDLELPGYSDELTAVEFGRSRLIRSMNEDYGLDNASWGVLTPAFLSIQNPKRVIDVGGAEGQWEAEIQKARSEGYDGIVYLNKYEDVGSDSFIAFEPGQIKSAESNSGEFNPNNPSILRSARMPYFYSELQRQIEGAPAKMGKLPAKEWLGWLKSNAAALGIKRDELQWSGLVEYLTLMGAQKLDRGQLVDFLTDSGLMVEVNQRNADKTYEIFDLGDGATYRFEVRQYGEPIDSFLTYMDAIEFVESRSDHTEGSARYGGYRLIGGSDYTELLVTARSRRLPKTVWNADRLTEKRQDLLALGCTEAVIDAAVDLLVEMNDDTGRACLHADRRGQLDVARFIRGLVAGAQAKDTRDNSPAQYRSAHWNERNVLAHIRFDIRADKAGRRTMFVQEIQSDWGQDGRKKGFLSKDAFTVVERSKDLFRIVYKKTGEAIELADRVTGFPSREAAQWAIDDARVFGAYSVSGIVDGPFVKKTESWAALAIKQAIVYAAQNGVQAVAFATGDQVAKIFDMKKTVESLTYISPQEGYDLGYLQGTNADGNLVLDEVVEPRQVADFVGESVAKKLFSQPDRDGQFSLEDPGLTVGGRGVMRFYDQVLPSIVKDVAKKTGIGQIEACDVGFGPQLSLPVSEELAERLSAEGMPLFRTITTPTDTPEFHSWFRASKVVDKTGAPLVVYHGTVDGRFTTFDLARAGSNTNSRDAAAGFFFTNDEDFAARFLAKRVYDGITGERIYEKNFGVPEIKKVYLSLQNPVDLRKLTLEVAEKLVATGALGKYATARQTVLLSRSAEGSKEIQTNIALARAELEAAGFDGIINKVLYKGKVRTEFMAFSPEQIKSADRNAGSFDPNDADITRRGEVQVHTPEFDRWAAGAPLVRLGESRVYRSGVPVVVEALHGTTFADITKFDPSRSHVESNLGRGIYASNTPSDVEANYSRENGPDMTNRKDLFIDHLLDNAEAFEEEFHEKGLDVYEASEEDFRAAAQRWADEKFSGGAPNTMKLFMRFQNPAVLGGAGETYLDYVMGEEDTVPGGLLADFLKKMYWPFDGISLTGDELREIRSAIDEALADAGNDGLGLSELVSAIEGSQTFIHNDEGDLVNSEWLRQMLERLGFDGVIDTTVYLKFAHNVDVYGLKGPEKMKGMNPSTVHFIAFDGRQVKSAIGNRGTFDPNNPDITRRWALQTQSPEFTAWFDGSRVLSETGEPLKVYHGTGNSFSHFLERSYTDREGFYFTRDPDFAADFAENSADGIAYGAEEEAGGASVMPVYLSLKNPVDVSMGWPHEVVDQLSDVVDSEWLKTLPASDFWLAMDGDDGKAIKSRLKHLGYDGLIADEVGHPVYVVFDSEQIKSAIGNRGTFDPNDADITRSVVAPHRTPEFQVWFAGSQAVDASNEPQVLFHGTNAQFEQPEGALWLSSRRDVAETYADGPDGRVLAFYAALKNPLVIDGNFDVWSDIEFEGVGWNSDSLVKLASMRGHDGLIVRNVIDGKDTEFSDDAPASDVYVVFGPEQLKSVDGNSGEFHAGSAGVFRREAKQLQTPEFARWFGKSKVSRDGRPLVVYHGASADFTQFDPNRAGQNYKYAKRGMFFCESAAGAAEYAVAHAKAWPGRPPIPGVFAGQPADMGDGTACIYPVMLSLQKPVVKTIRGHMSPDKWFDKHHEKLYAQVQLDGADGIIVKGDPDSIYAHRTLYVALKPEQIKSAFGNRGTFDPNDPDITRRSLTQELSPEFTRWFEGSKVVDGQGLPRKVFHGSMNHFSTFDMAKAIDGAMWFATERDHAGFFADRNRRPGKESTGKLYEVYLAIRNPLIITQDQLEAAWSAEHPDDLQDERSLLPRDMVERFVELAKERGHDGLMIKEFGDLDFTTDVYLAFDPCQIKSATDNDGQFDPLNPDILRSLNPPVEDDVTDEAVALERLRA